MNLASQTQGPLDAFTGRWWLPGLFALLFFLPAYAARPFDPRETSAVIVAILPNSFVYADPALLHPLFKFLPLLLIAASVVCMGVLHPSSVTALVGVAPARPSAGGPAGGRQLTVTC
jgi:hypothetical protein